MSAHTSARPFPLVRTLGASVLSALFVSPVLAAPAADGGPFSTQDREDLVAAIRQCDPAGRRRINERFDAIIDELRAIVVGDREGAAEADRGKKSKERKKKGERARGPEIGASLGTRLASTAAAWQLSRLSADLSPKEGTAFWTALENSPNFAHTLALTVDPASDKVSGVWEIATELVAADTARVESLPELAAAICVVHDDGNFSLRVNENRGVSAGAKPVWNWFSTHAGEMRFGMQLAPELLAFVVDLPAGIDEAQWAFQKFRGASDIGPLYQEIEYDFESLQGKEKKSNVAGWNLPNILKHGGICADQAYFTTTVGKALGIPAVYTSGQDASVGHAWAGFVKVVNKVPGWEVSGRYDSYRGVTGIFRHPQSGKDQNDAMLAMLVAWGTEPAADRVASADLRIADERIQARIAAAQRADAPPEDRLSAEDVAALNEVSEALVYASLQRCPTDVRSWERLKQLGKRSGLDRAEMERWFGRITDLCGAKYPEMVLDVSMPLIKSLKEPSEQHKLWTSLADYLSKRADLASQAMIADGEMWESNSQDAKAADAYDSILKRYPDAGPPTEQALAKLAEMFRRRGDNRRLLALYESVFSRMTPPKEMASLFGRSSSWFRVGTAYADVLRTMGRGADAKRVNDRLLAVVGQDRKK
jgi:hypothetical protein